MIKESKQVTEYITNLTNQLIDKFEKDFYEKVLPDLKKQLKQGSDVPYIDYVSNIYNKIKSEKIIKVDSSKWRVVKYNKKNESVVQFFKAIQSKYGILKKYVLPYVDTSIKHDDRVFKIDLLSFKLYYKNEADVQPIGQSEVVNINIYISYDRFFTAVQNKFNNRFSYEFKRELINKLSHELTHVYDYIISGKFEEFPMKQKYKKFISKSKVKDKDYFEYRMLPSEINSFYVGAISSVKKDIDSGKIKRNSDFTKSVISKFAKYYMANSINLKSYPKEIRLRLLSRLYSDVIA